MFPFLNCIVGLLLFLTPYEDRKICNYIRGACGIVQMLLLIVPIR